MKQRPEIDRVLQVWMADGPTAIPDRVVDVVAARIGVQRQRRAWPFRRRTTVTTQFKLIAALAAALVVAVVGYNLLPGKTGPGSPSTAPTPSAQPTAAATAAAVVDLPPGTLTAGRYRIDLSFIEPSLSIVADIPAGWVGHPENPALTNPAGSNEGVLIGFMQADRLFSDPCNWDLDGSGSPDQQGDVVIGPTVADLVSALHANTSYTSSNLEPLGVGGFQARFLELQLPGNDVIPTCDRRPGESTGDYFVFPGGFYAQGPNSRWQLYIVDVDGPSSSRTRLITLVSIAEETPEADIVVADAIVGSFEITP